MREHTHLPAMVRFVRKHVAQHLHAHRPGPSPAVSAKRRDAALTTAKRFRFANGERSVMLNADRENFDFTANP